MYDGDRVAVVVPAYNETQFVGEVITTIPDFVDIVIAVDDCSDDGTWQVIQAIAEGGFETATEREVTRVISDGGQGVVREKQATESRVIPVRHQTNTGRGGAVKTGYQIALNRDVDVVAVMDGDGQMDPENLEEIVSPVVEGEADYAKGNRLASREQWSEMPRWRLFGNVILTLLTKLASGYWWMRDPQNGYTAISTAALEQIDVQNLYDDYGFLNDVLIRLGAHDMRVTDVTMEAVYGDESSDIRYASFVPSLSLLLVTQFLWRLRVLYSGFVSSLSQHAGR